MRVLLIKPYGLVSDIEIKNDLETLQKYVDGYIEVIYRGDYAFIVNEEGRLKNLPENIGGLVGNIIIARYNDEDFESLTDDDVAKLFSEIIGE